MKLLKVVDGYIAYKRCLGMRFVNEGFALRAFSKAMGNIDLRGADSAAVMAFIGDATKPGRWRCYFGIFRSFYRYAIERGIVERSPLPRLAPRFPPQMPPSMPRLSSGNGLTLVNYAQGHTVTGPEAKGHFAWKGSVGSPNFHPRM